MSSRLATLLLLGVTAVWGWTFAVVHEAVAVYSVSGFLALRFLVASALTLVMWGRYLTRRSLLAGLGVGLLLALGYLLQTWGLRFTTATNAGLITGLFVVIAPLLERILFRVRSGWLPWAAAAVSLVGMTLLTGRLPTSLAVGDLLVLGCAFGFGSHIAALSRVAQQHDPRALGTGQMVCMGALFLLLWPALERPVLPPAEVWPAILLTGAVASALAYFIQTTAQRHLSTSRTAILLTTEPMFAGLFGFLLLGERLAPAQLAGAALILGAVVMSEALPLLLGRRPT